MVRGARGPNPSGGPDKGMLVLPGRGAGCEYQGASHAGALHRRPNASSPPVNLLLVLKPHLGARHSCAVQQTTLSLSGSWQLLDGAQPFCPGDNTKLDQHC